MSQHADQDAQERITTLETRIRHAPVWFPGNLNDLLQTAYANRLINEKNPLVMQKERLRKVSKEIVEDYPPY